MRVNIVLEQRFVHTRDGATYDDGHATYALWQRYLAVFGEVRVVARSQLVREVPPGYRRADGPGVRFLHVPFYQGPGGLARRLPGVLRALAQTDGEGEALIVRLSGVLAHLAALRRQLRGRPFAAEVINDPYLGLSGEGMQHPLRRLFRALLTGLTRWQCRAAVAVQYVTRAALQRRYPPGGPSFGVSDAVLPPEAFGTARRYAAPARRAVLVGSVEQPHKAVDVVLRALAQLRGEGLALPPLDSPPLDLPPLDLHFTLVGDGPLRPSLEALARELGVADAVTFAGQASTPVAVRAHLEAADLFLMPSRTEGLPRALLEAMALGLPALGSDVGGIPELLDAPSLVQPGSVLSLADGWRSLSQDPSRLTRESARNLEVARGYADAVLSEQRAGFLRTVRRASGPEVSRAQSPYGGRAGLPPLTFLYTTTTPIAALAFFADQLGHLRQLGHTVHLVTPPTPAGLVARARQRSGATFHPLPMAREISPRGDLKSLWGMYRLLRQVRPDVINFSTPKAGLLGGLASVLSGVPLRVYFIHGLRSETAAGGAHARLQPVLRFVERLTCACAHEVLCVSASNRDEAVALGLVPAHKIRVLGSGSPAGLSTARYARPDPAAVAAARLELGLPEGTPLVGFVGRLAPQKGVEELLRAWELVQQRRPDARLLLLGEPEEANPLSQAALDILASARGVVQLAFEHDMTRIYPLMQVITLPSRHEGLGMVVLEANAAGVPSVVTDAPGVRDAAADGVSGLVVPQGDVPALAGALLRLLDDPERASALGDSARQWVREHFEETDVWAEWDRFYAQAWAKRQRQRQQRPGRAGVAALIGVVAVAALALRGRKK